MSPQSSSQGLDALDAVDALQLEHRLRDLNISARRDSGIVATPGQRISEYERALTPSRPHQPVGFKVIKRADGRAEGVQLEDFPNEILTHILSHLHPDSHAAVALVSKRFYALVTTPHAWRMAFQRFFPGQDALSMTNTSSDPLAQDDSDTIRSEVRHFTRLTAHASWRSEYLLRTRLLRGLARGKPGTSSGGIGSSARNIQAGKKLTAVLTYNSRLPSIVTNVHAVFTSSNKKPPRVIHAAADMCVGSASDPTSGRVEKWGLDDPFAFAQADEVVPQIMPYGVGEGSAVVPNVMDVSQAFGIVGGEGFPGGRVFYRPSDAFRGKYLGQDMSVIEPHPDIPKIPELSEAVCSIWIAKSSAVPMLTQSMIGILAGSTLGVLTAYSLGHDASGPRYANGEITARWVLCPGVPIVSIKVDESYSPKRKSGGRVWAVALNALGEVYYLTEAPTLPATKSKNEDSLKCAWYTGRSAYWHMIESTRRQARSDESGKNAVRGAYSPRSPSDDMNLTKEQIVAEAREIEKFLRYKPAHFRKVCEGWDMRRRLEVDFASDDEHGAGESIFIIECGLGEEQHPAISRFTRHLTDRSRSGETPLFPGTPAGGQRTPSLFGGDPVSSSTGLETPRSVQAIPSLQLPYLGTPLPGTGLDGWHQTKFCMKGHTRAGITTSNVDSSTYAIMTASEDPLNNDASHGSNTPATPTHQARSDIPGRRARLLGIGTNSGAILLWDMRAGHESDGIQPLRVIQTASPEISSLAISSLYLVHGGSDGLVQAWDPLASTLEPIRTLNSRSSGRIPRHLVNVNPALRMPNFAAAGAIYLDPDPTILRGVVSFGTFIRYWAYSSSGQPASRKRRLRHSDVNGRLSARGYGGGVKGFIVAETEELRLEQERKARENARLRSRFGVGFGDLTEEEAIRYAEMISQESFQREEQRRTSTSDTGSLADFDTTSATDTLDNATPEPSLTGRSPPASSSSIHANATLDTAVNVNTTGVESDYERQIQQAIRLSLMEGGNDAGQSSKDVDSGDGGFPITYADKYPVLSNQASSSSHTPIIEQGQSSAVQSPDAEDEELQLALALSLAEEEDRKEKGTLGAYEEWEEFPVLGGDKGKGKGRAV